MKRPEIKYDPIKQEKKPFWMHSVERSTHGSRPENITIAILFCIVIILLYVYT